MLQSNPCAGDTDETKIQEMSSQDVQDISMVSQDLSGGGHSITNTHDVNVAVEYLNENDAPNKGTGDAGFGTVNTPKNVNFTKKFRCPPPIYICIVLCSYDFFSPSSSLTLTALGQYSGHSGFNHGCVIAKN